MSALKPDKSRLLAVTFGAMIAGRLIGAGIAPALLAYAPLLLIVLSPFLAHLVLVAGITPLPVFVAVALGVSLCQCVLGHTFGSRFGPQATDWIAARVAQRRVAWVTRALRNAAPIVLLLIPGPVVCTLAGIVGVKGLRFYGPMVVAQVLWIGLCAALGSALLDTIGQVQSYAADNVWWLTALCVVLATLRYVRGRRLQADTNK